MTQEQLHSFIPRATFALHGIAIYFSVLHVINYLSDATSGIKPEILDSPRFGLSLLCTVAASFKVSKLFEARLQDATLSVANNINSGPIATAICIAGLAVWPCVTSAWLTMKLIAPFVFACMSPLASITTDFTGLTIPMAFTAGVSTALFNTMTCLSATAQNRAFERRTQQRQVGMYS